jgi:hypothetical protein
LGTVWATAAAAAPESPAAAASIPLSWERIGQGVLGGRNYSKEVLLKIATLGTLRIDPDHPGTTARAVMFGVGVTLVLVGLLLILLEKLHDLGIV